jgi:hypothetical protein
VTLDGPKWVSRHPLTPANRRPGSGLRRGFATLGSCAAPGSTAINGGNRRRSGVANEAITDRCVVAYTNCCIPLYFSGVLKAPAKRPPRRRRLSWPPRPQTMRVPTPQTGTTGRQRWQPQTALLSILMPSKTGTARRQRRPNRLRAPRGLGSGQGRRCRAGIGKRTER